MDQIKRTPIDSIKRHHENQSDWHYWFSPDAMKFFRTRFVGQAWTVLGRSHQPVVSFFITSDLPPHSARRFTVRKYTWDTHEFECIGVVCQYWTKDAARDKVKSLLGIPPR